MSDSRQGRIMLQLYENHIKTRQNIEIQRALSYDELISKLKKFFKRQNFRLQLYSNNPKSEQPFTIITQKVFKEILSIYKGLTLNINTKMYQQNAINHIPAYVSRPNGQIQPNKESNSHILSQRQQQQLQNQRYTNQNNNHEEQNLLSHLKKQDELDKLPKKSIRSTLQIINKHELMSWNQSCKTQEKQLTKDNDLKKICSQCDSNCKGCYFVCLVCQPKVILCNQCESKEDFFILKSHKFRQHPFAKIKRWTQQIKSVYVVTQQTENSQRIQLKQKNIEESNIKSINQLIDGKLRQAIQQKRQQAKERQ